MEGFVVWTANGDIRPSRFVKIDATLTTPNQGNRCLECDAGETPIGVSQKGTRYTPLTGLDNGFAASAGQGLQVYGLGQVAPLELGGTVAPGDYLKSDADGKGVAASVGEYYGAVAPMAGISGQIMDVQVVFGKL